MNKYWLWLFALATGIISAYNVYVGFESGSISNLFNEDGKNNKFAVDESPVMFWLNMGFHISGILAAIGFAIILGRKNSTTPEP